MKFEFLKATDPEVYNALMNEYDRQKRNIELIASENIVSQAVMETMGSYFTNKYAEGFPNKRYYGGCQYVDDMETIAIERVKEIFGSDHSNVQPHSGSQANQAVYLAVLNHGDTVLGMDLSQGGHLTHGSPVNVSGINYNFVAYGVDPKTETIDYDRLRELAIEHKPKLIVAGASAYAREIDFKRISEVAKEVGAYFMVDMAHIAGLVAAGLHQNPVPYADFVTSTTHKTLRGPRGGIILCREEFKQKIDKAIFPGLQGGPLEHIIAAKAVCFKEAMTEDFKEYQKQVVKNAQVLAEELVNRGFNLVSNGTDNHLILINLVSKGVSGKKAETLLDEAFITVNKNSIPFDKASFVETSGIRIGTPAVTTRGMKEDEMKKIAEAIDLVISKGDIESAKKIVVDLTDRFPLPYVD